LRKQRFFLLFNEMESRQLSYQGSTIHYCKMGKGTRFLFCFHGYGEDATSFRILEKVLGNDYTIIAIDMPFHGQTHWHGPLQFTPADLAAIINTIVPLELQTISLMGYSMGGRLTLALLQHMPEKIDRVALIAPDGLHKNFWYWLATQTKAGNRFFKNTMEQPGWVFAIMRVLQALRLMNKSIFKFAHSYLDDNRQREMLYKRWTTLRFFKPDQQCISRALRQHAIPVHMLFGQFDRIILAMRAGKLHRNNSNIHVKVMKAGHQLLKEKYAREIAALLYE